MWAILAIWDIVKSTTYVFSMRAEVGHPALVQIQAVKG
jgi:hypothetical protein